ncbi:sigma-70 family RNA polymerase sigma factor [Chitinophagaceae bacterium 26-R-25]|nr:sigma-70 family RNA polymerase sigma factor [Chitinophagaceae bacterium 26-R-25]
MQELIEGLKKGDVASFNKVFEIYWKPMYTAAFNRLGDEQIAQDIVQDLFIKIWDKRTTLQFNAETIENYLFKSVKNSVINHFVAVKSNVVSLTDIENLPEAKSHLQFHHKRYADIEFLLSVAIEKLPDNLKEVFKKREENKSIKQIAEELGLAEQTVKNYISEALRVLRKDVQEQFERH